MDLNRARFYAIDIETTGLKLGEDEIVSFASVPICQLKIMVRDIYYTLIRPGKYNYKGMKYHGISKEDLLYAPVFEEVSDRVLEVLDGFLVGHTVEFDFIFLKAYFKALGVKIKRDCIDIVLVEQWLNLKGKPETNDLSLDEMIRAYGLQKHYRHNAAADAFFAAQIFQMQLQQMMSFGVDSTEKMLKAVKSCRNPLRDYLFYG